MLNLSNWSISDISNEGVTYSIHHKPGSCVGMRAHFGLLIAAVVEVVQRHQVAASVAH